MKIEEKEGKMIISDFDELDAYKIARKIEKDGIKFYQDLSQKCDDSKIKETLNSLATEEKKHLRFFEQCLNEVRKEKEDSFEEDDLLSTMDFGVFQPYQSMEDLEKAVNDIKTAIKLAVVIEEKTVKFYEACKLKVSSLSTGHEIDNIIEEEKRHKKKLKNILSV